MPHQCEEGVTRRVRRLGCGVTTTTCQAVTPLTGTCFRYSIPSYLSSVCWCARSCAPTLHEPQLTHHGRCLRPPAGQGVAIAEERDTAQRPRKRRQRRVSAFLRQQQREQREEERAAGVRASSSSFLLLRCCCFVFSSPRRRHLPPSHSSWPPPLEASGPRRPSRASRPSRAPPMLLSRLAPMYGSLAAPTLHRRSTTPCCSSRPVREARPLARPLARPPACTHGPAPTGVACVPMRKKRCAYDRLTTHVVVV